MSDLKSRVARYRCSDLCSACRRGACVAVNYRERSQGAASVVDAIELDGGRAIAIAADVSIAAAAQSWSKVEERLGPITVS